MKILSNEEAITILPEIWKIVKREKHLSAPNQSEEEFKRYYLESLSYSVIFIEQEGEKIKHFAYIELNELPDCFAWLLYSDKCCWNTTFTKQFVETIKDALKSEGIKRIFFKTQNTKQSYVRWVAKLGATVHEKTFKVEL